MHASICLSQHTEATCYVMADLRILFGQFPPRLVVNVSLLFLIFEEKISDWKLANLDVGLLIIYLKNIHLGDINTVSADTTIIRFLSIIAYITGYWLITLWVPWLDPLCGPAMFRFIFPHYQQTVGWSVFKGDPHCMVYRRHCIALYL